MPDQTVYFDNNATTRLDPRVLDVMMPYLTEDYGNPSSMHHFGAKVAAEIEQARSSVAAMLGARESEIVFTSGGTESNNAALRGVAAARPNRRHIITTTVEHHAVLEPIDRLEQEGYAVTRVGVDAAGHVDLDALRDAIRDDTLLISIMLANNETGVIHPVAEIAKLAAERGVLVHTDAVCAIGKMPTDVVELGVHLLTISTHKFHGPKGCGALFIRRGTPFRAMILGGPQERDRRGGTHNAPALIGMGKACELVRAEADDWNRHVRPLRDRLETEIAARFPIAHVIAADSERVPNTSCICFEGVEAEALLLLLSEAGVCASSGAACSSGSLEPSHVLQAMGIDARIAQGQIRFSLCHWNTDADVDRLLEVLPAMISKVAAISA